MKIDDEFWKGFVDTLDENKDGKISYEEFEKHMIELIDEKHCLEQPMMRRLTQREMKSEPTFRRLATMQARTNRLSMYNQ